MIYRIIGSVMFSLLVIALMLSFIGVEEVYLGDGVRLWLTNVQNTFEDWSFSIPKIPNIPYLNQASLISRSASKGIVRGVVTTPVIDNSQGVGAGLKNIINIFIFIVNFLISVINVIIVILNVLISIIRYILTLVYCVKDLPEYLRNYQWERFGGSSSIWWWRNVG